MAKQMVLEGFVVRPIAYVLDLEAESIEPRPLGEQMIKPADAATWFAEQWPELWAELKEQIAQQWEDEANNEIEAKRAARKKTTA